LPSPSSAGKFEKLPADFGARPCCVPPRLLCAVGETHRCPAGTGSGGQRTGRLRRPLAITETFRGASLGPPPRELAPAAGLVNFFQKKFVKVAVKQMASKFAILRAKNACQICLKKQQLKKRKLKNARQKFRKIIKTVCRRFTFGFPLGNQAKKPITSAYSEVVRWPPEPVRFTLVLRAFLPLK
jgi:ribosomal protein S14